MGLFNAISEWRQANYEKKITKMRSQGTCPDCYGRGFNSMPLSDIAGMTSYVDDCHGCNGSGLFADWAVTNQQQI
jgi:DnaJ-class molecular chaperone